MGIAMAASVERSAEYDVVVPVPTTSRRLRARGYNQAEVLAASVARRCGIALEVPLVRVDSKRSQTALGPRERRANVDRVFRSVRGVAGTALLVDDVLTTASTAGEAARVLRAAGAARVDVVTYARALPRLEARNERSSRG